MKIEDHGSFCNIYRDGGVAFGTKQYSVAKEKLTKYNFDIDTKTPLFAQAMKDGTATLVLNPVVEFLFPEDREDIDKEVRAAVRPPR